MSPSLETANVGKAVAARVGTNIREVRTKLGMTQAQLAAPEFSISYISAIERGKIRPSLKALSILARRLDVPLTFLLEGSPSGAAEARAVGYSPADSGPDQKIDVDLLQASVLVQQGAFQQAEQLLAPIQPERITADQVYRLYLLRGQIHLGANEYQQALVVLRAAVTQGEGLNDIEFIVRARNLLGRAYFLLYNYTLAMENHLRCNSAIENGHIQDPVFASEVFSNLANDYFRLGDLEKAVTYYHRALDMFDGMNRDSQSYKASGKLTMTRDYTLRSLALYEMRDEQRLIGLTHQRLGKTLEKRNDLDEAEQEYRRAIAIEHELNDAVAASTYHTSPAELLLKRGNKAEAEKEAQEALTFARASEDPQAQGQTLIALAQIRHQTDDFVTAVTQDEGLSDIAYKERTRNFLGKAYFHLYVYTLRAKPLAMESLLRNIIRYLAVNFFVVRLYFLTDLGKDCPNSSNVFKAVKAQLSKRKCKLIYVIGAILRLGDCSETLA